MIPYGNIDESNHVPNENFMLELFYRGIHLSVQMINADWLNLRLKFVLSY